MITLENAVSYLIPLLALVVSLLVAYSNSRSRSIDLALKYSELINGSNETSEEEKPFNRMAMLEAHRARDFYIWKSCSNLTNHKHWYFNYVCFLIYVCCWVGASTGSAVSAVKETGSLPLVYPIGLVGLYLQLVL